MRWEYCTYQSWGRISDADLDFSREDSEFVLALERQLGPKVVRPDKDHPGAYKLKKVRHVEVFAILGGLGWELVSHSDSAISVGTYAFKRPVS